jgi:hypothetical protein
MHPPPPTGALPLAEPRMFRCRASRQTCGRNEDRFSEIAGRLGSVRAPNFQELAGTRLATLILTVIGGLAVAFLVT